MVLVLVFVFGVTAYNLIGDVIDKRKLDSLDRNLVELTGRINAEFGTETLAVQRYCKHDNVKFGSGPLVCAVQLVTTTNDALLGRLVEFLEGQEGLVEGVRVFENRRSLPDGSFLFSEVWKRRCSFDAYFYGSPSSVYPELDPADIARAGYDGRVLVLRCTLGTRRNFYQNIDNADIYFPLFID